MPEGRLAESAQGKPLDFGVGGRRGPVVDGLSVQPGVDLIGAYPATNARPLLVGYISRLQPVTARLRLFNIAALALEMRVSDPVR